MDAPDCPKKQAPGLHLKCQIRSLRLRVLKHLRRRASVTSRPHPGASKDRGAAVPELGTVAKTFGQVTSMNALIFSVDSAQISGIIDRSGAGKSTILR